MWSKNKARMTAEEERYVEWVKQGRCIVCDAPGPSDAHEIEQGNWFTSLSLCKDCHQGSHNGIHGRKAIWSVLKLTELGALNLQIQRFAKEYMGRLMKR